MKMVAGSIREYGEELPVEIIDNNIAGISSGRPVVRAYNEGGFNYTAIDIFDLLKWISENRPEWLEEAK